MYAIIQLYDKGYKVRYASNNLEEIYKKYEVLNSINIKCNEKNTLRIVNDIHLFMSHTVDRASTISPLSQSFRTPTSLSKHSTSVALHSPSVSWILNVIIVLVLVLLLLVAQKYKDSIYMI